MFLLFLLPCIILGSKQVKFRANHRVMRELPSQELASFSQWFCRPSMLETILKANPGLTTIEKIADDVYEGKLSPLQFPGLKVIPSIRFLCKYENNGFEVQCTEDSLQQEYEGSKLFASWLSKILPKVASTNRCSVDPEKSSLINEASLEIKFNLPTWFPIPAHIIDEKGSAVIQQGLDKDLTLLLDNIFKEYENQSNPTSPVAK